jgi:3-hydroxyisobutyrate dehydrogenase
MADKPSVGPAVGFVGVGNMGWPMAASLVRAGFTVHVNDARREVANNFVQQVGGDTPDSLRQLAAASDVVITMLPTSAIVEHVLATGDDTVMAGMKPGTVVIEMSSGVPSATQLLAERVAQLGGYMIDAPVSGGVPRAKTGELAIMAGGDSAIIDQVMPVLSAMGTSVLRTGAVGSGQAMKALNNLVSAGGFLIGIEALLIGQRFGLDPAVMVDVLNAATGMNNSTQKKFKQFVLSRKFDAGFTMGLLAKDLSIALQVGRETDTPAPLAALCKEMVAAAQAMFGSDADHTEMAKLCERLAGTELGKAG